MPVGEARISVEALGDAKLAARLQAVPAAVEKRLVRSGLKAGAQVLLAEVRARAPRMTGATLKSLRVKRGSGKRGVVQYRIFTEDNAGLAALGARRTRSVGKRGAKREGFYPAAVEFGFVRRGPKGTSGEHVPARSFMRAAITAKQSDVFEAVRADMAEGLDDIASGYESVGGSL